MSIKVLAPDLAAKIAAGEVVWEFELQLPGLVVADEADLHSSSP